MISSRREGTSVKSSSCVPKAKQSKRLSHPFSLPSERTSEFSLLLFLFFVFPFGLSSVRVFDGGVDVLGSVIGDVGARVSFAAAFSRRGGELGRGGCGNSGLRIIFIVVHGKDLAWRPARQ